MAPAGHGAARDRGCGGGGADTLQLAAAPVAMGGSESSANPSAHAHRFQISQIYTIISVIEHMPMEVVP
jgi:hypothetical protein